MFWKCGDEPFRAYVVDKLPDSQVNKGFVMQGLMIGLGGTVASSLPWVLRNIFSINNMSVKGVIAENVKFSFYIGAFFFLAAVLYSVITTKEYPPTAEELEEKKHSGSGITEIFSAIKNMPQKMKIISLVQFFTWPGLFLMWFYYSLCVAYKIFGATSNTDQAFGDGKDLRADIGLL